MDWTLAALTTMAVFTKLQTYALWSRGRLPPAGRAARRTCATAIVPLTSAEGKHVSLAQARTRFKSGKNC